MAVAMNRLDIAVGSATQIGLRSRNDDVIAVIEPTEDSETSKGWLFALADGVSQSADGKLAAQSTIRGLTTDYYATPATWEVTYAIDKIINAQNLWLNGHARGGNQLLTTLSAFVVRGRHFTLAHIGDCRAYRLRTGHLEQLSEDHVWMHEGLQHVLKRAVGLDKHILMDYLDGELVVGDVFTLLCDGVWESLGDKEIHRLLQFYDEPQEAADMLVKIALELGSQDNVSAIVFRILDLPAKTLSDEATNVVSLSIPPKLKPTQRLSIFTIESILSESSASTVYLARDEKNQRVVIKTLTDLAGSDKELVQNFLAEIWLMKRAESHYLPELIECPDKQWLLLAMRWYPGETLADKLNRGDRLSVTEVVRIALRLSRAIGGLHRLNILHRDIKPENLHIDREGKVRILDLGVAHCSGITPEALSSPGTPSYLAPEQFGGASASVQTDLYALGVTLYFALTRRYPYGEIEPFQTPHFGNPTPPTRYRPDIPIWLEQILLRLIARDPVTRFETADKLRVAFELGESYPQYIKRESLVAPRTTTPKWLIVIVCLIALNLFLIFILLVMLANRPPEKHTGEMQTPLSIFIIHRG